jgi:hypothetical protein
MRRLACLCAAIVIGAPGTFAQSKPYALPAAASEGTSVVNHVPNVMVLMDEGGTVPSEPAATCDNRVDGNSKSTAGFHLEHYFAGAKDTFDQKVSVLRQYMGVKQAVQLEAADTPVVTETLDGLEAAYAVVKRTCVQDTHPSATRIEYHARLIRGTMYADLIVQMYAADPDAARKYVREMVQKIGALNFASVK